MPGRSRGLLAPSLGGLRRRTALPLRSELQGATAVLAELAAPAEGCGARPGLLFWGGQNTHSTMRVDEYVASSMSECAEVEGTGRKQDTSTAPCMNLRARWNISATRQGLP